MHSALQVADLFLARTFWEWKREREKGNEGWCNSFSGWRKETEKITRFGILKSGQNPRIPPDPQMVSIMAHRGSWEQQYLAASTKSYWQKQTGASFSSRGEPANYWKRHDVLEETITRCKQDESQLGKSKMDTVGIAERRQKLVLIIKNQSVNQKGFLT